MLLQIRTQSADIENVLKQVREHFVKEEQQQQKLASLLKAWSEHSE